MARAPALFLLRFAVAALSAAAGGAMAQPVAGSKVYCQTNEFVCRAWGVEDGLPQDSVTAILQTRDGYLWLGTRSGLARFDGVRFTVLGVAEGLQGLHVRTLCQDQQGALWIGTASGLSRYHKGRFTTFTTRDGLPGDLVNDVAQDGEGGLWVATSTGLSRWQEGRFQPVRAEQGLPEPHVRNLAVDAKGAIWASVLNCGLLRWDGRAFASEAASAELRRQEPYCLTRDGQGRIWAGYRGMVLCFTGATATAYGRAEGVPNARIDCLAADAGGTMWAGTFDRGLYYLREGKFQQVPPSSGLTDTAVQALAPDREGNLWVGTRVGGLNRLKVARVATLRILDQATEIKPMSLAEEPENVLWVGTSGRGLYRILEGTPAQMSRDHPQMHVRALAVTRDGSVWGGRGETLCQWKDSQLARCFENEPWLRGDAVECLCETAAGLWIGTRNGRLVRWTGEGFAVFTNGLPASRITTMAAERDGTLWVGFHGAGLGRIQDGACRVYDKANGLLSATVRALLVGKGGTLWIGTEGGGLSRLKEGRVYTFSAGQGIRQKTIVQLLTDDQGLLWLGTYRGIYRVAVGELEAVAAGKRAQVHPLVLDRSDGMQSAQCIGASGAALRTRSGQLWFCTDRGIAIIDPQRPLEEVVSPRVHLEQLRVDDRPWPTGMAGNGLSPMQIPPGNQQIEFRYTGLNLGCPERVRFRYRLEGLDPDWVDAGERRRANYSYIPPGKYRFRVTARNGHGLWATDEASLALTIEPQVWQTWWFRTGLAGALAAGLVVSVRYVSFRRLQRQLRLAEQQAALQRERARIAKDIHDDLGANLTQIALLGELAQRDEGRQDKVAQRLGTISTTARQAIKALDEIVWAVNPRNDTLSQLVEYTGQFALDYLRLAEIRCRLDFPDILPARELSTEVRHNLFLAVKEALTNVVRHAAATEVWFRVRVTDAALELAVEDNGRGFSPVPGRRTGNGVPNLCQRLSDIGGEARIESRPGTGTQVVLRLGWTQPLHVFHEKA